MDKRTNRASIIGDQTHTGIKDFFYFLIEEIPSILTIIGIPLFFGVILVVGKTAVYFLIAFQVLLLIYLWVKAEKRLDTEQLPKIWLIGLIITITVLSVAELFVIIALEAGYLINIKTK